MKSNKQRRQEIKAQRLRRMAKQARAIHARPIDRPIGTVGVTLKPVAGYNQLQYSRLCSARLLSGSAFSV